MLNMNNISFNCDGTSISGSEGGDSGVVSVGDIWSWYYWFIVSVVFYQLWFNSIWTFLFYHKYINYIGVTVRYVPYKFVIFHHSLIYDKIYTQPHLTLIFLHLLFEFIFFVSQKQYIFSCLITAFPHLDMKLKDEWRYNVTFLPWLMYLDLAKNPGKNPDFSTPRGHVLLRNLVHHFSACQFVSSFQKEWAKTKKNLSNCSM